MADTLGDRIRHRRQVVQTAADAARQDAQDWAKDYSDNIHAAVRAYIDEQVGIAKTYVDDQIAVTKTYVDTQVEAVKAAPTIDPVI